VSVMSVLGWMGGNALAYGFDKGLS